MKKSHFIFYFFPTESHYGSVLDGNIYFVIDLFLIECFMYLTRVTRVLNKVKVN